MALLDAYPGLKVMILVDDEPLPECENREETPAGNKITKYSEAQSEKGFKIMIKFGEELQRNHSIQPRLSLDGMTSLKGSIPLKSKPNLRVFKC